MTTHIALPDPKIRVIGRADIRTDALAFDWTNSGVCLRFRGKSVTFHFETPALSQKLFLQITIDGYWQRLFVNGDNRDITITSPFEGEHIVYAVRVTEILDAVPLVMSGITLDGEQALLLDAPMLPTRKMLFIGDSITCGFGILTDGLGNGFNTDEQDGAHTYAALTATHFQAESNFICISGRGIARNCDNVQAPKIPEFFELTTVSNPTPWDHTRFVPDVVVLNAGTNDTAGEKDPIDHETFKAEGQRFLRRLRECYPNAGIIWCYGMMATGLTDVIRDTVESLGDEHMHFCSMQSVWGFENERGACSHPNMRAHRRCSGVLIDKVYEITDWDI